MVRPMASDDTRITLDPRVLAGKAVIRGTRFAVEFGVSAMTNNLEPGA